MAIETIGEAWRLGWLVHMRCAAGKTMGMRRIRECVYIAQLTLVCTRGRDFPLSLLASRLRCPRCGSRQVSVLYAPPVPGVSVRAAG